MKCRAALLFLICATLQGLYCRNSDAQANWQPRSFGYVLQADAGGRPRAQALKILADSGRDLLILDGWFSSDKDEWTHAELNALRAAKPGRKVLAYLSVGEAEDYRIYWKKEWDANHDGRPDAGAPDFLLPENPQWKGNYRVKYWKPAWQNLILPLVDDLMAQGFDGLYLDIVDGFETFEQEGDRFIDNRPNKETGQSFRRDMVDWVTKISRHARSARKDALIVPQNGSQLLANADFLALVDAIGMEDVFTEGNKRQETEHTQFVIDSVAPLQAAGKPVFIIEYPKQERLKNEAKGLAERNHFVWLITDRALKTPGESGPKSGSSNLAEISFPATRNLTRPRDRH